MPEDLKVSQIGSSQRPPPFRGLHSPGVRKHCQIIFACYFRKSSIVKWLNFLTGQRVHFALRPQKRDGLLGTGTRGGGRGYGGGVGESEASTADTARKRPERRWTSARTTEVLRRCPLAIAQRLVHRAIAVSTVMVSRVTRTMSAALLLGQVGRRSYRTLYLAVIVEQHLQDQLKNASAHDCRYEKKFNVGAEHRPTYTRARTPTMITRGGCSW